MLNTLTVSFTHAGVRCKHAAKRSNALRPFECRWFRQPHAFMLSLQKASMCNRAITSTHPLPLKELFLVLITRRKRLSHNYTCA
jgi:hypothetical protein